MCGVAFVCGVWAWMRGAWGVGVCVVQPGWATHRCWAPVTASIGLPISPSCLLRSLSASPAALADRQVNPVEPCQHFLP